METSKYNYFTKYKDRTVCLNGVSGKTFSMDEKELELFNRVLKEKDKQLENPSFTEWLIKNRFLIESHAQELDYMIDKNIKTRESDYYTLFINPTQECNFNCWYCYEKHEKGYMNEDVISKIKSHFENKIKDTFIKSFYLGWFGGEPLLYFKKIVYPLSIYIKKKCTEENINFNNSITTNGYLINKKMISMFDEIDLLNFQITIDGEKTIHDKIRNQKGRPSFDRIIMNCIEICNFLPKSSIILRINYTDESIQANFKDVLSIIPFECRKKILIQFQRVWQTVSLNKKNNDAKIYLKENENALRENGFEVSINHNYSVFKGHVCYADRKNYANINYDGNVFRCTAREFSQQNSLGYLNEKGEIIWTENILEELDSKPYFCNEKCLKCKYLPLCGGPCFQKTFNLIKKSNNFCVKDIIDADVETFIIQHYLKTKEYNKVS